MSRNVYEFFLSGIDQLDKISIIDADADISLSYKELDKYIKEYCILIKKPKKLTNTTAVFVLEDSISFISAFWAVVYLEYDSVVIINPRLPLSSIQKIVDKIEVDTLFISNTNIYDSCFLEKKITQVCFIKKRLILPYKILTNNHINPSTSKYIKKGVEKEIIFFTSGSTGEPKGVVHSLHNIMLAAETFGDIILELSPKDCLFSLAKMFQAYGFGNSVYLPFYKKSCVIISNNNNLSKIHSILKQNKVTIFFSTPTIYKYLIETKDDLLIDSISNINKLISAGEVLSKNLEDKWMEVFNNRLLNGFGMTETLTTVISNNRNNYKESTVGVNVADGSCKILLPDGKEAGFYEVGELVIYNKTLMNHYLGELDKKDYLLQGFYTGDLAYRQETGFFSIVGRKSLSFKKSGKYVFPPEIEDIINTIDIVEDNIILPNYNTDICTIDCYIKVKKDYKWDMEHNKLIKRLVKSKLEHYKCPNNIIIVSNLIYNSNGKKVYKKPSDNILANY